mmetsp:Transcript_21429/g.23868  ORF Transcript_21429/g.23868 Transcript_21429/m.23868 type:complete len:96 (-) Transcript_21429:6-293(-)
MEMTCVELARHKTLRIEKNSKREIANEYAKGIGRPFDQRENMESVLLDNTEDQTLVNDAYDEYSYQSPSYNNLSKLEDNHNNYASEIEKIKSMFN